jgi:hypothetical protein
MFDLRNTTFFNEIRDYRQDYEQIESMHGVGPGRAV